ncbi:MADS-box transcription factor ANR1 [Carex littledalei]|uniref:MADS-box transcription factor ANR1 n=1 Tax=Carex littledalei TaxID=544730 RepID=A0A833RAI8_9POAL|nr:MADS-box transcription factor ANR1 [Carex littledalei]
MLFGKEHHSAWSAIVWRCWWSRLIIDLVDFDHGSPSLSTMGLRCAASEDETMLTVRHRTPEIPSVSSPRHPPLLLRPLPLISTHSSFSPLPFSLSLFSPLILSVSLLSAHLSFLSALSLCLSLLRSCAENEISLPLSFLFSCDLRFWQNPKIWGLLGAFVAFGACLVLSGFGKTLRFRCLRCLLGAFGCLLEPSFCGAFGCQLLTGEDLAGIDAKDLQNLENQLEASLKVIRVKKDQAFSGELQQLRKKGGVRLQCLVSPLLASSRLALLRVVRKGFGKRGRERGGEGEQKGKERGTGDGFGSEKGRGTSHGRGGQGSGRFGSAAGEGAGVGSVGRKGGAASF